MHTATARTVKPSPLLLALLKRSTQPVKPRAILHRRCGCGYSIIEGKCLQCGPVA